MNLPVSLKFPSRGCVKLSGSSGNNFLLVVGSLFVGAIVSGIIVSVTVKKPVEKVDDIRSDLEKIKIILILGILGVGIYVGIFKGLV